MKNYFNKLHPAVLATLIMSVGISLLVLACMHPFIILITTILAGFGMLWVTIYEAIITIRRVG